jgi:hypothetical protein
MVIRVDAVEDIRAAARRATGIRKPGNYDRAREILV